MKSHYQKYFLSVLLLFYSVCIYTQDKLSINNFNNNTNKYGHKLSDPILPVTLLYFEGFAVNDRILLRWGTATELNNYGFDIERTKLHPIHWEVIGFEFGHGNSNSPKHYTFWDTTVVDTSIYVYRLKQINTDGTFEYSDTIHVNFHVTKVEYDILEHIPENFHLSQNYPNPFNPETTIEFVVIYPSEVRIKIFDLYGREINSLLDEYLPAGKYSIKFKPSHNLASGVYVYNMFVSNFTASKKMIYIR